MGLISLKPHMDNLDWGENTDLRKFQKIQESWVLWWFELTIQINRF